MKKRKNKNNIKLGEYIALILMLLHIPCTIFPIRNWIHFTSTHTQEMGFAATYCFIVRYYCYAFFVFMLHIFFQIALRDGCISFFGWKLDAACECQYAYVQCCSSWNGREIAWLINCTFVAHKCKIVLTLNSHLDSIQAITDSCIWINIILYRIDIAQIGFFDYQTATARRGREPETAKLFRIHVIILLCLHCKFALFVSICCLF